MPLDWSPLVALLRRHHTILLMTHIRPDADGLGSQLALADALVRMGKRPRVAIASKLPPRYAFLDPQRKVIEDFRAPGDDFRDADLIVVMDTGTWNQLGDFADFLPGMDVPKAVVDHHRTQDDLGATQFVDVTAEATGRLTYEIIRALGAPLSQYAAQNPGFKLTDTPERFLLDGGGAMGIITVTPAPTAPPDPSLQAGEQTLISSSRP